MPGRGDSLPSLAISVQLGNWDTSLTLFRGIEGLFNEFIFRSGTWDTLVAAVWRIVVVLVVILPGLGLDLSDWCLESEALGGLVLVLVDVILVGAWNSTKGNRSRVRSGTFGLSKVGGTLPDVGFLVIGFEFWILVVVVAVVVVVVVVELVVVVAVVEVVVNLNNSLMLFKLDESTFDKALLKRSWIVKLSMHKQYKY